MTNNDICLSEELCTMLLTNSCEKSEAALS